MATRIIGAALCISVHNYASGLRREYLRRPAHRHNPSFPLPSLFAFAASAADVLLRDPRGRPFGLPLTPLGNCPRAVRAAETPRELPAYRVVILYPYGVVSGSSSTAVACRTRRDVSSESRRSGVRTLAVRGDPGAELEPEQHVRGRYECHQSCNQPRAEAPHRRALSCTSQIIRVAE